MDMIWNQASYMPGLPFDMDTPARRLFYWIRRIEAMRVRDYTIRRAMEAAGGRPPARTPRFQRF